MSAEQRSDSDFTLKGTLRQIYIQLVTFVIKHHMFLVSYAPCFSVVTIVFFASVDSVGENRNRTRNRTVLRYLI